MIKKLLLPLLILLVSGFGAKASHFMGMEIWYEYTGTGNIYRVYANEYAECQTGSTAWYFQATINCQSATTGQNFSRVMNAQIPYDTLNELYCPSVNAACGSAYQLFYVRHFSDTITLTPASDWKLSYADGARSASIVNLQNPSAQSIYVEAFLNNLTAPNSCAHMVGTPQLIAPNNNIISQPFQVIDGNGDSVAASMIQPLGAGGVSSPVPYAVGYSAAQPMGPGSFTQLNVANSVLKTYGASTGRFTLAARAYDYRNGQVVGYSSRDWVLLTANVNNPKAPTPATGTNFTRTTCPGQPTSYTFNFIDSVATDSVFLQFAPPANGLSYTTSYTNGVGTASATISFTTPTTWNVAANPYFLIKLTARDHACPISGIATYNVVVHSIQCNSDTVWAGDADANYVVNMYDPLAVALAYNATGPVRSGASIAWTAQWCANWAGSFATTVNYKHADCDGNGTVNNGDIAAITANYSLTHPRPGYAAHAKGAGLPDLYLDHTGVNPVPGITLNIPVKFGSTAQVASNIYGLATRIRINGISPNNVAMTYPSTWLGTAANTLRFTKSTTPNTIDWAYARTDHQNISGSGMIGTLSFGIPATAAAGDKIIITMEDVKVINATGTELTAYNVLSDTILVKALGVGNIQTAISNAVIVPNPSLRNAVLMLDLLQSTPLSVAVTDITGKLVWQSARAVAGAGTHEVALPQQLRSGLYFVRINTDAGTMTLKWIEE